MSRCSLTGSTHTLPRNRCRGRGDPARILRGRGFPAPTMGSRVRLFDSKAWHQTVTADRKDLAPLLDHLLVGFTDRTDIAV